MATGWRRNPEKELGRALRRARPEPSESLVHAVQGAIEEDQSRARRRFVPRLAGVAVVPVAMILSLASTGAIGYAAVGARHAMDSVKNVVVAQTEHSQLPVVQNSSGQSQYGRTKVTICHKGHTIVVAEAALKAHLAHGDKIGPC